jgi:predicted nucleic acid-binding protein
MSCSSFPINADTVLVADASVIINLNASGCARDIIRAQPGSIVVTENALSELAAGVHKGHNDREKLQALIDAGAVRLVPLGEAGNRVYTSLVEGLALRTLDDGEAATIGYALESGGIAMIDERKARTICASDFPELTIASTIDLLTHELVQSTLGKQGQTDAIVNALRGARMRVPPHQIELVVKLIGAEAAASCNSLPKVMRVAP